VVYLDRSARGDVRCHDMHLTGTPAASCNGAGAEIAYDFTTNGVGQLLDQQISHTLTGVDLVWSPAVASNDSYITNGLNPYTSVTGTALSYDGNGNLTSDLTGQSFTFDAENVLREVNGSGGAMTEYRYYADGTRAVVSTDFRNVEPL